MAQETFIKTGQQAPNDDASRSPVRGWLLTRARPTAEPASLRGDDDAL
jgi:hypothetical protein